MAKTKQEVTVKEEAGALAVIDFGADTGAGFEEADSSSYAIPFLRMLQATSDQTKKTNPNYIKGAEEGDLFNTVTEKVYKGETGVIVVPCHFIHKYNEWAPDRGGFRGSHSAAAYSTMNKTVITDSKGNQLEGNADTGNVLQDSREHYVLIINEDGAFEPALLALTGTQLKKSKKWMTLMQNIRVQGNIAPMFSQMYKITPVGESNDKGSWSGLKIEHIGPVTDINVYNAAKQFREMVRSGVAEAAPMDEPF